MSTQIDPATFDQIERYDVEKRLKYLLKEVVENQTIWILTDEHGCVMLNTEEEDCAPVWPNKEFAQAWATGEWQSFKAEAISLDRWHKLWSRGLEDDGIAIVVFPNQDEEGIVLTPDEFDYELKQQAKKRKS